MGAERRQHGIRVTHLDAPVAAFLWSNCEETQAGNLSWEDDDHQEVRTSVNGGLHETTREATETFKGACWGWNREARVSTGYSPMTNSNNRRYLFNHPLPQFPCHRPARTPLPMSWSQAMNDCGRNTNAFQWATLSSGFSIAMTETLIDLYWRLTFIFLLSPPSSPLSSRGRPCIPVWWSPCLLVFRSHPPVHLLSNPVLASASQRKWANTSVIPKRREMLELSLMFALGAECMPLSELKCKELEVKQNTVCCNTKLKNLKTKLGKNITA